MEYDRFSFIMGMITAFSECVAAGCKRLALSPPMTEAEYLSAHQEAERIIEAHGLIHMREENRDLPEGERFEWILIARRRDTFDEYLSLRGKGFSPARSLEPFYGLLSYGIVE